MAKKWNQMNEASIYIDNAVNAPECEDYTPDTLRESGRVGFGNNKTDDPETPIRAGNSAMSHLP